MHKEEEATKACALKILPIIVLCLFMSRLAVMLMAVFWAWQDVTDCLKVLYSPQSMGKVSGDIINDLKLLHLWTHKKSSQNEAHAAK